MRPARLALGLLAACLGGLTAQAAVPAPNAPGRYAPRDECSRLPGAAAFRAALASAVRRRDADALAALAGDDVTLDFGGGSGPEELRQRFRGDDGDALWRELAEVLRLGCAVSEGDLVLPWFFAQDIGDEDPFEIALVAGANMPMYSRPSAASRKLRLLSWQLVKVLGNGDPDQPFQQVQIVGTGQQGYVETTRLRSQIDYRLVARRSGKGWKFDVFVAGD